ncbi:MAG: putative O-glycosylation ligase, exosortase A system-associated [Planctomycetes bacterium]|nr:putative O-glycosylation ligase, exosortase A system-associated [Planctomycetota bacterium]
MRDFLVFAVVMLGLPYAYRRPFLGLLLFSWLAYMRPQDLCWGFARDMRFSFYVGFTMIFGWWVNEAGRRRFTRMDVRAWCMVLLLGLMTLSLLLAERQDAYVIQYYIEYVKIIFVALFTIGQVDSRQRLRWMLWTICLSLAFFGVKGGVFGVLTGGAPILRGPGGMIEDNNDFALALVMNVPLLFYLARSEQRAWLRLAADVGVVLTLVTVLLTHSRGGFLAAGCALVLMAWRAGRLLPALGGLALLGALFLAFAPASVKERLGTITAGEQESSIAARFKSWSIAMHMIEDNPVLGVGLRNFQAHWPKYYPEVTGRPPGFAYVAHNSYLQIWAEGGTIAFTVYLVLLGSVFAAAAWLRRYTRRRADLAWAFDYARLFETTTVGFMVGAVFLNRGHFDLLYHVMALVSATMFVVRGALAREPAPAGADVRPPLRLGRRPVVVTASRLPRWERAR